MIELNEQGILEEFAAPFMADAHAKSEAIKQADIINPEQMQKSLTKLRQKGIHTKAFWESMSDIGTGVGYDRTLGTDFALLALYTTNDTVHSCVSYNANCCASAEFGVFQDGSGSKTKKKSLKPSVRAALKKKHKRHFKDVSDVQELNQHPLLDLLQNQDEDLDHVDFVRLTVTYLKTLGKGYWHLQRNNPGDDTEIPYGIRILKPWWVFPQRDMEGNVIGYYYTNVYGGPVNGSANPAYRADKVWIDKCDIIDFRYPAPADPYGGGDSPLRSAFIKTSLASKFNEWQSWLLNNRARIDGILTAQTENADEKKIERLAKAFNDKFKGGGNGGILTTDQAVKFTPVSYSPTDMGPLQVNEQLKTAICNALHTPVALLDSDPKYSNLETSIELHAKQAVDPDLCLIAKKINKYLVPLYEDNAFFAFEEVIPTDANYELEKEQAENLLWQTAIQANMVSQNEVRARLGLDDVDNGDDTQADEEEAPPAPPQAPAGEAPPVPGPEAPPALADQPGQPAPEKGQLEAILKINEQVMGGLPRSIAINILSKALQIDQQEAKGLVGYPPTQKAGACSCGHCAAEKGRMQQEAASTQKASQGKAPPELHPSHGTEAQLAHTLTQHYQKLKDHFLSEVKGKMVNGLITKGLPADFVPIENWSDDLAHASKPLIEIGMKQAAGERQEWYQRAGASPDVFSVLPHEIDKSANSLSLKFAKSTLATTTQKVNDALDSLREDLKQGLIDGDGIPEMTDKVQSIFTGLDENHAQLIAQSETQRAVSEGQRISAKASGLVSGFKLLVSDDACDICQDLDGQETGLDGSFESDDYAGSLVPVHPGCRCTVLEVLSDDDQDGDDQE